MSNLSPIKLTQGKQPRVFLVRFSHFFLRNYFTAFELNQELRYAKRISNFSLGAGLLFLFISLQCGAEASRYQPSGVSMRLWVDSKNENVTFHDYIRVTRLALEKYHWKLDEESQAERQARIEQISPREWPKSKECGSQGTEGLLLIHGLSDSPFLMNDIGDTLNKISTRCLLIRSILLPGHATYPGDLRKAKWQDWVSAAKYGIESFQGDASAVHVVGFSTGGALAIYWAINSDNIPPSIPIKSLVLLSPAVRIVGLPAIPKIVFDAVATTRNETEAFAWQDKFDDQDFAKYESFPLYAGYQLYLLDRELDIHNSRDRLHIPVFMALSLEDATVDPLASIQLFRSLKNAKSSLFLVTKDTEKIPKGVTENFNVKVKEGNIPSQNILSFSHISFPVIATNPHYGKEGDYANCLHYMALPEKFCLCKTEQMKPDTCTPDLNAAGSKYLVVYGEKTEVSEKKMIVRRLSFNPYFDEMLADIEKFISTMD